MITYFSLLILGYFAAITPGPDSLFVIRNGILYGFKGSLTAALGILTGNIVYLALVYLGLSNLGKIPIFVFLVSIFGGGYLLYLSIETFKHSSSINFNSLSVEKEFSFSRKKIFIKSILTNLSNPKAILFFSSVLTPFLKGNILLGLLFLYTGISLAFFTVALFSTKLSLLKKKKRLFEWSNKIIAILFLIFSIKLFLQAIEEGEKFFHN